MPPFPQCGDTDVPRTWFDSLTSMSDFVHSCDMEVTESSQSEFASTTMKVHEEAYVQLPDPALVDKLAVTLTQSPLDQPKSHVAIRPLKEVTHQLRRRCSVLVKTQRRKVPKEESSA